jgi:hypothetical protein
MLDYFNNHICRVDEMSYIGSLCKRAYHRVSSISSHTEDKDKIHKTVSALRVLLMLTKSMSSGLFSNTHHHQHHQITMMMMLLDLAAILDIYTAALP